MIFFFFVVRVVVFLLEFVDLYFYYGIVYFIGRRFVLLLLGLVGFSDG